MYLGRCIQLSSCSDYLDVDLDYGDVDNKQSVSSLTDNNENELSFHVKMPNVCWTQTLDADDRMLKGIAKLVAFWVVPIQRDQ